VKRKLILWHPESPGEKIIVYRGFLKRLFYPSAFATLTETLKEITNDKRVR